ncbi:MAG: hypothetical protein RID81_06985 [Sandaracinaceae bacterium]
MIRTWACECGAEVTSWAAPNRGACPGCNRPEPEPAESSEASAPVDRTAEARRLRNAVAAAIAAVATADTSEEAARARRLQARTAARDSLGAARPEDQARAEAAIQTLEQSTAEHTRAQVEAESARYAVTSALDALEDFAAGVES